MDLIASIFGGIISVRFDEESEDGVAMLHSSTSFHYTSTTLHVQICTMVSPGQSQRTGCQTIQTHRQAEK